MNRIEMRGHAMNRREFIMLIGGAPVAWRAHAQQSLRAARLGYFAPASNPDLQQALLSGLRDLGYVEGQNLTIEYRFMLGQPKTYDELAAELARLAPDAIVAVGTPPSLAAKRQTTTIGPKLPANGWRFSRRPWSESSESQCSAMPKIHCIGSYGMTFSRDDMNARRVMLDIGLPPSRSSGKRVAR